jgi:hypothetical protein
MTTDYDDPQERDDKDAPLSDQDSTDALTEQLVSRFYGGSKVPPAEEPAPKIGPIKLPQFLRRQGASAPTDINHFLRTMFPQKASGASSTISPELKTRREQIALLAIKILKSEDAALNWFHTPALFGLSGGKPIDWLGSLQVCDIVEGMLMKLYPSDGNEVKEL